MWINVHLTMQSVAAEAGKNLEILLKWHQIFLNDFIKDFTRGFNKFSAASLNRAALRLRAGY